MEGLLCIPPITLYSSFTAIGTPSNILIGLLFFHLFVDFFACFKISFSFNWVNIFRCFNFFAPFKDCLIISFGVLEPDLYELTIFSIVNKLDNVGLEFFCRSQKKFKNKIKI